MQREHDWFTYRGMTCCRLCGILKRVGGENKPCPGPVKVTTRGTTGRPPASTSTDWSRLPMTAISCEERTMTDDSPETLAALRSAGWAPGSYIVACVDCEPDVIAARRNYRDWRMGDKRSIRCRPCAEKVAAGRIADDDAMVEESIRRIVAEQAAREDAAETPPIWGDEDDLSVFPELDDACREAAQRVLDGIPGMGGETQGVDTSSEAVERLARQVAVAYGTPDGEWFPHQADEAATTLRALAAERGAAISRAEAAERERDALLVVARAAKAVAAWKDAIHTIAPELGGSLRSIYALEAVLDSLPPEVRAKLDQSEG